MTSFACIYHVPFYVIARIPQTSSQSWAKGWKWHKLEVFGSASPTDAIFRVVHSLLAGIRRIHAEIEICSARPDKKSRLCRMASRLYTVSFRKLHVGGFPWSVIFSYQMWLPSVKDTNTCPDESPSIIGPIVELTTLNQHKICSVYTIWTATHPVVDVSCSVIYRLPPSLNVAVATYPDHRRQ